LGNSIERQFDDGRLWLVGLPANGCFAWGGEFNVGADGNFEFWFRLRVASFRGDGELISLCLVVAGEFSLGEDTVVQSHFVDRTD